MLKNILFAVFLITSSPSFLNADTSKKVGQYTVFTWPSENDYSPRSYQDLAKIMQSYSTIVGGTVLSKKENNAQKLYLQSGKNGPRNSRRNAVAGALGNTNNWCQAVKSEFVDKLLPIPKKNVKEFGKHLQYGDCSEGARVGVCLAKQLEFKDDEMRICQTRPYYPFTKGGHVFGLLAHPTKKWCILDRWFKLPESEVDWENKNFQCGVEIKENEEGDLRLFINNKQVYESWYTNIMCIKLEDYMKFPSSYIDYKDREQYQNLDNPFIKGKS